MATDTGHHRTPDAERAAGWRKVLTPIGLFLLLVLLVVILGVVMSLI